MHTNVSTGAIGGVLMQGGREKPCVFVSHTLSKQATRCVVGLKGLELFTFVFCVFIHVCP